MSDGTLRWAVAEYGRGPAIVLVHGLASDATAWDRVVPDLAREHRVITVDLPGYSLRTSVPSVPSAAELAADLIGLLDDLGVESAVFVGHSLGGSVCVMAAHERPERCAGLVLIAPGGFGKELNPVLPLLGTRVGARLLQSLYAPRTSRAITRIAARVQHGARDERLRIAELMETYDRLRTDAARQQFRASVQLTLELNAGNDRSRYAGLDGQVPVLVLWGREDRVLPVWQAKNAIALLPQAIVHTLDHAGHTPHRSHPDQVTREIAAFADSGRVLRRLTPAGS